MKIYGRPENGCLCHALTLDLFLVWSGCDLGGHSMSFISMICISMFLQGMVLNQGQLSIVVSDWESYLGSPFPLLSVWVVNFVCGT